MQRSGSETSSTPGTSPAETLTSDQSLTCEPTTFEATPRLISSLALADGGALSGLQDGRTIDLFGQEVVLASPSPSLAAKRARMTRVTSGRFGLISSTSVALQSSLENRLQALLPKAGLTKLPLTWKGRATPLRRRYCQLVPSAPSTEGTASGLLPTPSAVDHKGSGRPRKNRGPGNNLRDYFRQKHGWLYPPVRIVRWLMGYPGEWDSCAPMETRSSRKSRQNSSERA